MAAKKTALENSYRFIDAGKRTGVLDANGKFTKIDTDGSITNYESWKDYLKELKADPEDGEEEFIVSQLEMVLGEAQAISQEVSGHTPPQKKETEMKNATKPAKAEKAVKEVKPKEVKEKKAPVEKVINDCQCGCGGKTGSKFVPGHDARFHGWEKKIARGEMKFSEIPASAAKIMKSAGIVQGVLAPKAEKPVVEKATTKAAKA